METNRTGEINLGSGLFIHKPELNHFQKFLVNKIKANSSLLDSYGMIDLATAAYFLPIYLNKVSLEGDLSLVGINANKELIVLDRKKELDLPTASPNTQYKLGITRTTTNIEIGTVNISTTGSIVGTDTLFSNVLRDNNIAGKASKIKFNSTLNTGEYLIQSVVDDTHIVVSGALLAEEGITYSVIGTHSADTAITEDDKYPFLYDSYSLSWIDMEDSFNETTSFQIGVLSFDGSSIPSIEMSIKTKFLEKLSEKTNSSGVNLPVHDYFVDNSDRDARYAGVLYVGSRYLVGNISTANPDGTDFSMYKDQIVEWDGSTWRSVSLLGIRSLTFIVAKDCFYIKNGPYSYSEYIPKIKQQYFMGEADLTTVPPFEHTTTYTTVTPGTYNNFLDDNDNTIVVTANELVIYNVNLTSYYYANKIVWSKIRIPKPYDEIIASYWSPASSFNTLYKPYYKNDSIFVSFDKVNQDHTMLSSGEVGAFEYLLTPTIEGDNTLKLVENIYGVAAFDGSEYVPAKAYRLTPLTKPIRIKRYNAFFNTSIIGEFANKYFRLILDENDNLVWQEE